MTQYAIVPTTEDHIEFVAEHMREDDINEVYASSGLSPYVALRFSCKMSDPCYTGTADDEPVCIFGVVPKSMLSDTGVPWLLGTDAVSRHARAFLRRNKKVVKQWRERFELLENYVDARNKKSIAWLEWLGFEIHPAKPYGVQGLPFHYFEMRRADHV